MGIKLFALAATTLVFSNAASAVVVNTLNGVEYEWLELTATSNMSRNQVEAQLTDANSALFGYEYASRSQVEDLFLSYSSWDGLNGVHDEGNVKNGAVQFLNDFGILKTSTYLSSPQTITTTAGNVITFDTDNTSYGMYGTASECSIWSCVSYTSALSSNGIVTGAFQGSTKGWDSTHSNPSVAQYTDAVPHYGSFLVKSSVVPVPAAVWLFGSGLIGLVGFARRKQSI